MNNAITKAVPDGKEAKKCEAIFVAKEPYRKKSYHSKIVPRLEATITFIVPGGKMRLFGESSVKGITYGEWDPKMGIPLRFLSKGYFLRSNLRKKFS